jgi:DNA mismatch repair protein MutS2
MLKMNTENTLEFDIILKDLAEKALSRQAKDKLLSLAPYLSESQCISKINETTEARKIMESCGTPPLSSMKELDKILNLTEIGSLLTTEQLTDIAGFLSCCRRMKNYLRKAEATDTALAHSGRSFVELDMLYGEIDRSVRNNTIDDSASPALRDIRRKIENITLSVREKLENMLRSKKEYFTDHFITMRKGRQVLSVRKEYKNLISGSVIDISGTGGTCFIEPAAVRKLQEEIDNLRIEEENEVLRILYSLTALVGDSINELKNNMQCMETLDIAFAKAKLSLDMKAAAVPVNTGRKIKIIRGRHPLLKQDACVPLDFEIGGEVRGIVITGPNTGGKTVALKTVGLLSLMAQSGLHIPAAEGSVLCMHNKILCDIGDGQSITENLSTFSSHITNITEILKNATHEGLVLLDELGSGTDPAEGMGIAIAVLEELKQKGCLFVATTHYPEVKDYVKSTPGLINARMTFDSETLMPLYRLEIGEAGESCALYIAKRLGFPEHLLKIAREKAYGERSQPQRSFAAGCVPDGDYNTTSLPSADTVKKQPPKKIPQRSEKFNVGDSVTVYPQKEIGFVYKRTNEKGEIGIQIKGKKQMINHKRLKLLTPASELYPENYDLSIVFDTVENRKARHKMEKRHRPDLVVRYEKEGL